MHQGTTREKVTFINLYRNNYKFTNMCAVLNISPKTYYKYRNKEEPDYYDYLYFMILKVHMDIAELLMTYSKNMV